MYIFSGKKWKDGFLDYYLPKGQGFVRVAPTVMVNLYDYQDMYFVRKFRARAMLEYVKELGIRAVANKIISRLSESARNEKFYSVGLGRIIEGDSSEQLDKAVVFVAPVFPRACERLVIPETLTLPVDIEEFEKVEKKQRLLLFDLTDKAKDQEEILYEKLLGWHPEAGIDIDSDEISSYLTKTKDLLLGLTSRKARALRLGTQGKISTRSGSGYFPEKEGKNAALFGLGNYAKTQIMPNLHEDIKIVEIHELDPTQIGAKPKYECFITTDPNWLRESKAEIGFVAGYHHGHAKLAKEIIEAGGVAAVEKPVVTTFEQLEELLEVERQYPGRLFSCYHMRYNPLFKQGVKDLTLWKNDAVHMSAQVYEVPLPEHHWYRWPNSQSHVVSNGCHWLDLFLFINDYSAPKRVDLQLINHKDSLSLVELENGASLCLHLTHEGSPRIGVQDYVSLRANGRTVTVINGSKYRFEDEVCLRRRKKINRMDAYKNMYETISESIINGGKGDGYKILETTNRLVLELNEIYFNKLNEQELKKEGAEG